MLSINPSTSPCKFKNVAVLRAVEVHHGRPVLGIVEEMQIVVALGQMDNVLAVQGVVGHRAAHRLTDAQTIRIVEESGGSARLGHLLELPALLLSIHSGAIIDKASNGILFPRNCAEIIHSFLLEYTIAALSSIGVSPQRIHLPPCTD